MATSLPMVRDGKTTTMAKPSLPGIKSAAEPAHAANLGAAPAKVAPATPRQANSISTVQPAVGVPAARPKRPGTSSVALPVQSIPRQLSDRASSSTMLMQVNGPSPRGDNKIRPTPSGRQAVPQLRCSRCACGLSSKSVEMGTAQMAEGKLVCLDCVRRDQRAARQQKAEQSLPIGKITLATVAVLAGLGVVFPSQILFVAAGGALLGVAVALLGFTIHSGVRLGLGVASIGVACGSVWGIATLHDNSETQRADAEMSKDSGEIRELIANDRVAEAASRVQMLRTAAQRPGATESLKRTAESLDVACDEWLKKNFGTLTTQDKAIVMRILSVHAFKNASGTRMLRSVNLDKSAPKMVVALDCKPADSSEKGVNGAALPVDAASLLEAAGIGGMLFQCMNPQSVEVQLINAGTDTLVGTFTLTPAEAAMLTSEPHIDEVMRVFKAN